MSAARPRESNADMAKNSRINRTGGNMGLRDYTIYSIMKRNARVHGDVTGWVCGDDRLTHAQFLEKSDRLAAGLLARGLKKGDRICVLAQNSMAFMLLYGAAARAGAIVLPINWRLQPEEVEYCVKDGEPKFMFVDDGFQELVGGLKGALGFVKEYFSLGAAKDGFSGFDALFGADDPAEWPDVSADDGLMIIHTAAVAGKPRGATLTHGGMMMANLQGMSTWNMNPEDCHLCVLPLFHIAGLGTSLTVMQAGGKNVILPRFDPDLALQMIEAEKVSVFIEFPPMLQTLLDRNDELKKDLTSLKVVGGMDGPDTIKKFEDTTGGTFWVAFGQSETSGLVTFAPFRDKPGSAGKPCFAADVEIMDDLGNILPVGETGEIVVRGPMVFQGYWNLPDDNAHTFRSGWHHTGDKGRFDEDGYMWYMGRMPEKELIKPGGENVYPAEVEAAVLDHPAVAEVSVIGVPDKQWGEAIKAVCVLNPGQSVEAGELIEFVASKIARFKKPKHVVFVPELPKAGDGSIDRDKVKAEHTNV